MGATFDALLTTITSRGTEYYSALTEQEGTLQTLIGNKETGTIKLYTDLNVQLQGVTNAFDAAAIKAGNFADELERVLKDFGLLKDDIKQDNTTIKTVSPNFVPGVQRVEDNLLSTAPSTVENNIKPEVKPAAPSIIEDNIEPTVKPGREKDRFKVGDIVSSRGEWVFPDDAKDQSFDAGLGTFLFSSKIKGAKV
jgi:enamine deaminase RidA (YjgF/YER057c/UK114 family)